MKNVFYCTKIDAKGNKLTSSYTNQKGVEKYGKGCTVQEDLLRADFSDPAKLQIRNNTEHFDGPVIRGLLTNHNPPVESAEKGRYVLWGKRNGKWSETIYHFPSYSAANSSMKSLIGEYNAMALLDTEESEAGVDKPDEPMTEISLDSSI